MERTAERHWAAARMHGRIAATHDRAADYWQAHGDIPRADLERRRATHQRDGEQIELDHAALETRTPPETG